MFQRRLSPIKKPLPNAREVSEARFKRFLRDLRSYERKQVFEQTIDSLLDLYSTWKRTHAEPLKLRMVMLAFELHRLDRHFQCDLSFTEAPGCGKSSSGT